MKYIYLFLFALLFISCSTSNSIYKSRIINTANDYTHQATKLNFPNDIYDFKRKEIISFDNDEENVGVTYALNGLNIFSEFTVYIYPAGTATEARLTQEYFVSLQSIVNAANKGKWFAQKVFSYKKDNYRVNGLFAKTKGNDYQTSLTLFECGKWFLKYRISTNSMDSTYLENLRDSLLKVFNPVEIVEKFPIKPEANIYIAPAAYKDTLMLTTIIGNALGRLKWINENVDSLERCSGFPNLYLKSFSIPLEEMIKWFENNKSRYPKEYWNNKYILTIKKVIEAGYINEFIMDKYSMLLIVPEDITLRFKDYYKWKEVNLSDFNFNAYYFVLEYIE